MNKIILYRIIYAYRHILNVLIDGLVGDVSQIIVHFITSLCRLGFNIFWVWGIKKRWEPNSTHAPLHDLGTP